MPMKEREDFGIEILVESYSVETGRVFANRRGNLQMYRFTRCQESEVSGVRHDVVVWLSRQRMENGFGVIGISQ